MRKLIDYFRVCFCKHDWELLDQVDVFAFPSDRYPVSKKWIYRCKKCGIFRKFED